MALTTVIVVAVLGTGSAYVLRRGWLAFHKAVGITPGTMIYLPPEQYQPVLLHLSLDNDELMALPVTLRQRLADIDQKSQRLQSYREQVSLHGTLPVDERHFVLAKLLQNELPQAIGHYNRHQHKRLTRKMSRADDVNDDATQLLEHIMLNVEGRLDELLNECQQDSLHKLGVIKRYLDMR